MKISTPDYGIFDINDLPNICPFCHKSITPSGNIGNMCNGELQVFFQCPDKNCKNSFIGYYHQRNDGLWFFDKTSKGTIVKKEFEAVIIETSEDFVRIYNESFFAEQEELFEICGVGYRKALEFLIKDYLIKKHETLRKKIENKTLGQCISDHVEDVRLKSSAKRATWLGNDETHYVKKWAGKNLSDLKKLIELTTHWIIMEKLTDSFDIEMRDLNQ